MNFKWFLVLMALKKFFSISQAFTIRKHYHSKLNNHYDHIEEFRNFQNVTETINSTVTDQISKKIPNIEIDISSCPIGCVCQYARFKDLPISRWIQHLQYKELNKSNIGKYGKFNKNRIDSNDTISYTLENPFIKQTTCIIQPDTDLEKLVLILPHDIEALILLYTGVKQNKTINASVLKPLICLKTLEIRGSENGDLRFILDTSFDDIWHANFEFVTLLGSENYNRPVNTIHPKEIFNYKPNLELLNNIDYFGQIDYEQQFLLELHRNLNEESNIEIVPYEIYREEVKKARMPSFYGWQRLQVLQIHDCHLNELTWETFLGLKALKYLSLNFNDIEELQPFAFSGATQLKTLSLAHNLIKDLHYRDLAGLFQLNDLDLSNNQLNKLTELSFPPLPKLKRIDFRDNPIRYIFPAAFWVMNSTEQIYFGSLKTTLELWSNMPFKMLNQLKELHMNNVTITNLDQHIFKELSSLEILHLHGNVPSIEFDTFAALNKLYLLDLQNCQMHDISMDAFIGCKQLLIINLSYNKLNYLPPGLFDDLTNLQEIYLEHNELQTLPHDYFTTIQNSKLKLIRLNNNPWQCSCSMINWKAKITNQERIEENIESCIIDYKTNNKLSCNKRNIFKINHKYVPRCANFKGRSVYYVLRKQIECKNLIRNSTHIVSIPHWRKLENNQTSQTKHFNNYNKTKSTQHLNHLLWQLNNNRTTIVSKTASSTQLIKNYKLSTYSIIPTINNITKIQSTLSQNNISGYDLSNDI